MKDKSLASWSDGSSHSHIDTRSISSCNDVSQSSLESSSNSSLVVRRRVARRRMARASTRNKKKLLDAVVVNAVG